MQSLHAPRVFAHGLLAAFLLAAVSACSTGQSVVGGSTDAGVVNDLGAADRGVLDVGARDAPDVPTGCRADSDCMRSEIGLRVCDAASGRCVACLPSNDTCPGDQHCAPGTNVCVAGCRSDDGCRATSGADAGAVDGSLGGAERGRCNAATNACVQCVVNEHCPAGTRCAGNQCVPGCDAARACPVGLTCCEGGCVDTARNTSSCGACGTTCTAPNAEAACLAGVCGVARCRAPFGDCDAVAANGCETDTLTSVNHCGGCGVGCPSRSHATAACAAGSCEFTCDAGFADCDGIPGNGCEVELAVTPSRCGACGTACSAANGTAGCAAGVCTVASCDMGFGDCDGMAATGCEVNVQTSTAHCGRCGGSCAAPANGAAACTAGACGLGACASGFADCNARDADGCEVDTRTTLAHCGGCGRVCGPANAVGTCAAGVCGVARCADGFADCDGDASNGCEVNTRSDLAHCGACRTACPTPSSGSAVCAAGACGIGTCDPGFGDCDGVAANGCETDIRQAVAHCGNCGNACAARPNAAALCSARVCGLGLCAAGFADCDGNPVNGCEVNTQTAVANCGRCGRACAFANGVAACVAGACALDACSAGFTDCNMSAADGCEVNTAATVTSCGVCGRVCSFANASPACAAGACSIAMCAAGYADCNAAQADGCEVNVTLDARNCGACGRVCASGSACVAGACQFGGGSEDRTVTTAVTLDPPRAAARGAAGSLTLTLTSPVGAFLVGQRVIVHQTQAAGGAAGRYEYNRVAAVGAGTLTLATPLANEYTVAGNDRAQVMLVTEFRTLTVAVGGTLAGPAWSGAHGGILAVDVAGALTVAGTVTMTGRGFRPQAHACNYRCGRGFQGEGVSGVGGANIARNATGGGGGGAGQDDGSAGGGGYGTAGESGVYTGASYCNACAESCPIPHGVGGAAIGNISLGVSLFFGGAGGEGGADEDGGSPGRGGAGGGAIVLRATTLTVSGAVTSEGNGGGGGNNSCGGSGCGMGGGGGGAGGGVRLVAATSASVGANLVTARGGGAGGASCGRARGGVGGAGRVSVLSPALVGASAPTLTRE